MAELDEACGAEVAQVVSTLMPGLLAGHRHYAHIAALRGDAVAMQAMGMTKVVSEDALRADVVACIYLIARTSTPAATRPIPSHSCIDGRSPRNAYAKMATSTRLNLSTGATLDASPT